jgi:glycosyltransferase XagB
MYDAPLRLPVTGLPPAAQRPRASRRQDPLIGELLVERGALDPGDLVKAMAIRAREDVRLGEVLLSYGMVSEPELYAALAQQWDARLVDLVRNPPDPRLIELAGTEACLAHRIVPWRRIGGATVIVTARPEEFARRVEDLPAALRPALLAIASEQDVLQALLAAGSRHLVDRAETRVPEDESCRIWDGRRFRRAFLGVLALAAGAFVLAPAATFLTLTFIALAAMTANTGVRIAAVASKAHRDFSAEFTAPTRSARPSIARLPVVSVLVPLYHETAIAERLVKRLSRLSYPRELLDICLVTEDNDETTRETLAATDLPRWMRVVSVPGGTLRTKPRALNYALAFCRGSIVGVYDAEDAPAPDQIHRVVARFHERGPDVACLQGILDFYNSRKNWMARCFTVEYAAWFRVVLPGLERLGLVVPLGGTTLFFRRSALEALGGWDAHNVTEDADLGVRLARHGYRTELIATVTEEEANANPWSWVRQRSRWIKGYAMTWGVHMRDPRRLLRDLGWRRFLGVQLVFVGSLAQVLLAPVLWSYWLMPLGLPHPVSSMMSLTGALALALAFTLAFAVNTAVYLIAARESGHRHLRPIVLTLGAYFPLATLAAAKAFFELVTRPFYWDKTVHGHHGGAAPEAAEASDAWVDAYGVLPLEAAPRIRLAETIGA